MSWLYSASALCWIYSASALIPQALPSLSIPTLHSCSVGRLHCPILTGVGRHEHPTLIRGCVCAMTMLHENTAGGRGKGGGEMSGEFLAQIGEKLSSASTHLLRIGSGAPDIRGSVREDPAAQEARDLEACRKEAAEGWLSEWMMFSRGRVLVVGDGNLSFSLALARAFPNMQLIATTFDSEDFVLQRYGAKDVISELKDRRAIVLHNIDARALHETLSPLLAPPLTFDCIVFNFPHHSGKGRIERNRELIRDFFVSATKHLAPTNQSQIRMSLAAGQGGTGIDKARVWGDTWQVTAQGAVAGLLLQDVHPFTPPPGYYCRGYRSQDKGFRLAGALQHVFVPQERGLKGLYPPTWTHDISFWVPPEYADEHFEDLAREHAHVVRLERLESFSRQNLPPEAAAFHAAHLPQEYQESRAYRVDYRSETAALAKDAARSLQLALRERCVRELRVVLR